MVQTSLNLIEEENREGGGKKKRRSLPGIREKGPRGKEGGEKRFLLMQSSFSLSSGRESKKKGKTGGEGKGEGKREDRSFPLSHPSRPVKKKEKGKKEGRKGKGGAFDLPFSHYPQESKKRG